MISSCSALALLSFYFIFSVGGRRAILYQRGPVWNLLDCVLRLERKEKKATGIFLGLRRRPISPCSIHVAFPPRQTSIAAVRGSRQDLLSFLGTRRPMLHKELYTSI
jgi:hypothetical protein